MGEINPDIQGKNYVEVGKYAKKYIPTEHKVVNILNSEIFKYYPIFSKLNVFFRSHKKEDQYKTFDCELIWIKPNGEETIIAKGELEYGADQNRHDDDERNWDNAFPREHWYCLSLLSRKKYDKNFEFFLKVSPTYKSAFVVDTRDDFVLKNKDAEYPMKRDSTNERFTTNNMRTAFNWDTVDNNKMLFEYKINTINKKIIKVKKNANFCLMEYEYWNEIIAFFAHRYFPEELKTLIKKNL